MKATVQFPLRQNYNVVRMLWGTDLRNMPPRIICDCLEWMTTFTDHAATELRWALQHGPNPEHRSPWWDNPSLGQAMDWLDAIHGRAAQKGEK